MTCVHNEKRGQIQPIAENDDDEVEGDYHMSFGGCFLLKSVWSFNL